MLLNNGWIKYNKFLCNKNCPYRKINLCKINGRDDCFNNGKISVSLFYNITNDHIKKKEITYNLTKK